MSASYLLRFDDICASMNWDVWSKIETILCDAQVCPILAVVPDNRDPMLAVGPPDPDFWQKVRAWQSRGWTIGMHGYHHDYVSRDPGILGLNPFSEFAGLSCGEQLQKLRASLDLFRAHNTEPEVWVAPGHSFDFNTVKALGRIGVRALSDGYALWPYQDSDGMFWLPQQLWRFRAMPAGVWTVCFHINGWTDTEIDAFKVSLQGFRAKITSFRAVQNKYRQRPCSVPDKVFGACFSTALRWRRRLLAANTSAVNA